MRQPFIIFNKPSGKFVVRLGGLPEHLGGNPGDYDGRGLPEMLKNQNGKIRLFDNIAQAEEAIRQLRQQEAS